ncbi:MAG: hypothetical protein NTX65_17630 [Ignavibacteriales bacterium]|nr:hypothetical protein [Ignavibacteriales bacterium]
MEIVPIISTALIIVLLLTLLTLALSYFYNKVKLKNGETVKPLKNSHKQLEQEEIIEDHLKPIPRPFADKKEKSIAEKEKGEDQKKDIGKISAQQKADNNTDKPKNRNKRLTILKNLTENAKQETKIKDSKKKIENEPTNSLGGEILDKYVEENDSSLYTLNVKAKKEKPKG